jgi:peptide/nickel transport system substrate-binding protein
MVSRWARCFVAASAIGLLLAGGGHSLAETDKTLRIVMHSDLKVLDPVWSSSYLTRTHGLMVYETLFAPDAEGVPQFQMLESHEVSPDSLTHTFRLRPGLAFHDGAPVRAADCIASIERWGKRDPGGQILFAATKAFKVVDDHTFVLELERPVGPIRDFLGKVSSLPAVIMPERIAKTDAAEQIEEAIGSGPFIFKADEWRPGNQVVYERNPNYVPRSEPADGLAGGRIAKIDRIEWLSLPDANTTLSALQNGEIDYYEQPPMDFIPLIRDDDRLNLYKPSALGEMQGWLRPNHLHPPFNNPKARQALVHLVDQMEYMKAIGAPEGFYRETCGAFFLCGAPYESKAAIEPVLSPDLEKARALMQEAGYKGEKVVVIQPTDLPHMDTVSQLTASQLRKIGVNVELQPMDWATHVTRRASKNSPEDGGWSIVHTLPVGIDAFTPANNMGIMSNCDAAWVGWPCDEGSEKLKADWVSEPDPEKRAAIVDALQTRLYQTVPYVIWGQYAMPVAYSKKLAGLIETPVPVFWNIEKQP